ncbi:MAG: hypothetical protein ACOY42_02165 [Pseudomonadota bacterium]
MTEIDKNPIASLRHQFIRESIERAERAVGLLSGHGIAVLAIDIGRWSAPVIRVEYSAGCEHIKSRHLAQNPTDKGLLLTRLAYEDCLVFWEEPLSAPDLH